jgi:hypothetical protein
MRFEWVATLRTCRSMPLSEHAIKRCNMAYVLQHVIRCCNMLYVLQLMALLFDALARIEVLEAQETLKPDDAGAADIARR